MSELTALLPSETAEKPFDQVLEHLVGELLAVAPVGGAEDAVERVGVGALDLPHGVKQGRADIRRGLADVSPVTAFRDREAVDFGERGRIDVAEGLGRFGRLLVPHVADPLEEEQRQDVALPVGAIDGGAAQGVGGVPEGGFQVFVGQRHQRIRLRFVRRTIVGGCGSRTIQRFGNNLRRGDNFDTTCANGDVHEIFVSGARVSASGTR